MSLPRRKQDRKAAHKRKAAIDFSDQRLQAGEFRLLNQYFYTHSSKEAQQYFSQQPDELALYHEGYRSQVREWPCDPVEVVVDLLRERCGGKKVADLGCGEGRLQEQLQGFPQASRPKKVFSVDLFKNKDFVIQANLSKLPIKTGRIDIAVFSLSLMGTDYLSFLKEASRVMRLGGTLVVVEVGSRLPSPRVFHLLLGHLGFKKTISRKLGSGDYFYLMTFQKTWEWECGPGEEVWQDLVGIASKEGVECNPGMTVEQFSRLALKPCLYRPR